VRIAIFHNRYREHGGEDAAVDAEAELLEKGGHAVVRCIADPRVELSSALQRLRVALRARRNPASAARAAELVREAPVDVAHVHNFFPVLSPGLHEALAALGVPVVQTLHNYRLACANGAFVRGGGICEECLDRGPWHAVRYGCYRGSRPQTAVWADVVAHHRARETWVRCVDRFATPTEFARRKIARAGVPAERIDVVANFTDDPGGAAPPGRGALFVGRLSPEKGVDLLIDAWRELADVPLAIAGAGPAEADLRARARGMPQVRFLGHQPRDAVLRALREAAFAVVPSRCYETSSIAAIEALACGRAVVAWRAGAVAETVEDGQSGLLFDALAPASVASVCRRLAADRELTRRLGSGARERYLDRHTPAVALVRREQLYAAVLDQRRRVRAAALGTA
jgi:glycosyltransferase involved in cell wall biosynthesis